MGEPDEEQTARAKALGRRLLDTAREQQRGQRLAQSELEGTWQELRQRLDGNQIP